MAVVASRHLYIYFFKGKNNVCVHPPALLRQEYDVVHYPGYLSITVHIRGNNPEGRPTLLLSWIPNTTLRASPWTVEKRISQPGFSRYIQNDTFNKYFICNIYLIILLFLVMDCHGQELKSLCGTRYQIWRPT